MLRKFICETCHKEFEKQWYPSRKGGDYRFCCKTCARLSQPHGYDIDFLDNPNTELYGYFMGLWVTDGGMCKHGKTKYNVTLNSVDREILEDIAKQVHYTNKLVPRLSKPSINFDGQIIVPKKLCYAMTYGAPIAKKLIELGYPAAAKTGVEFVPSTINKENFPHFLRGVIDGDGWITFRSNTTYLSVGVISASKLFLEQLQLSIKTYIGVGDGSIKIKQKKTNECMETYTLRYQHNDSYAIGEYIYQNATLFLKRKYDRYIIGKQNGKFFKQEDLQCKEPGCLKSCFCQNLCYNHYYLYYHREYKQGIRRSKNAVHS